MKLKKLLLPISLLVILTTLVTGCNTVEGAGQDISQGGRAISNAANDSR